MAQLNLHKETDSYQRDFETFIADAPAGSTSWLEPLRKRGLEHFVAQGFPTVKQEEWRFTNVLPIKQQPFTRSNEGRISDTTRELVDRLTFTGKETHRLVFLHGHFCEELSSTVALPQGVRVSSLKAAFNQDRAVVERYLGKQVNLSEHTFAALNTAFIDDGAFIHLPKGVTLENPLQLIFVTDPENEACVSYPRNLIVVGEASQLTVIESYAGSDRSNYFTNAVSEFFLAKGAICDHYKLQEEGELAFHVANQQVEQQADSQFVSHSIGIGSQISRNDIQARLDGTGCTSTLNGLYLGGGNQLMDNHTLIDHAKPHCQSFELYRGVLDDRARGVFNGKIFVRQDAQKTDAKQSNNCLLLSGDAVIDTKPQLEIFADDVKCTHGATIGQLEEDAIFYLRSRGISATEARKILTFAFANEVVAEVKLDTLKETP